MWSILIKLYAQKRQSVLYGCCLDIDYVRVDQPLMSRNCHSTNTPNSIAIFTANSNNSDKPVFQGGHYHPIALRRGYLKPSLLHDL